MGFQLKRINPNQTQVYFADGRFETLTDEELEDFLSQVSISESGEELGSNLTE
jgi:AMMECR1 domain-containing protein